MLLRMNLRVLDGSEGNLECRWGLRGSGVGGRDENIDIVGVVRFNNGWEGKCLSAFDIVFCYIDAVHIKYLLINFKKHQNSRSIYNKSVNITDITSHSIFIHKIYSILLAQ